jgi:hypothetical protein
MVKRKSYRRKNNNKRKTRKNNKKINLELCPHCGKSMREHTHLCPYCASPVIEDLHTCPYCKMCIHGNKKGGSGCGPFGCPIAPLSWKQMNKIGGSNMCGITNVTSQYGGSMPGPFVGSAWTGSVANWPGVNGVSGDKNYLEMNKYSPVDISRQMELNDTKIGGKRRRRRITHKYKKGGASIMKDDLVNLGRDVMYNFKSTYNTLNGYAAPVDPAPYRGHFSNSQRIIV